MSIPETFAWQIAKDPGYAPYCLRCPGLVRMRRVEPLFWQCSCGAVHDVREFKAEHEAELAAIGRRR